MVFVEKPIINSPFHEPTKHYKRKKNKFSLEETRRPSGYWEKKKQKKKWIEKYSEFDIVNLLRKKVKKWREGNYPNISNTSKYLLKHWNSPDRHRKLFFCQRELIETVIWLIEAADDRIKDQIPLDNPHNINKENQYNPFIRYCGKMATGTGKTLVMAALIAWQILNHLSNPQDPRFSNNILVVTPNRTVKQRDEDALLPSKDGNYYEEFDLVPRSQLELLYQGNFFITNWHYFLLKDDSDSSSVVKKGKESDKAFVQRIKNHGFTRFNHSKPIFILNDEAHHAYRPSKDAFKDIDEYKHDRFNDFLNEYEAIIQTVDDVDGIEKLKESSLKKDRKLAKKIEKMSKSEIIEIRRKLNDYYKIKRWEKILDINEILKKKSNFLKNKLEQAVNVQENKELIEEVKNLTEHEIKQIKMMYETYGIPTLNNLMARKGKEFMEATTWIDGLDRIHSISGISYCIDLTATPYYPSSSGYPEGTPFDWIITDFCLADAIESGITKIPRYPLKDNSSATIARYYKLWEWIKKQVKKKRKRGKPKPEEIYLHAEDALKTLEGQWKRSEEIFQNNGYDVPPLMIIVCNKINTSTVFYERISQGSSLDEFKNPPDEIKNYTLQIDSKKLDEAEAFIGDIDPSQSTEEAFRSLVANVGKPNTNGQDVRCLISVGMLSEGWDAHNVTQILGVRAFSSSLLCEQVVGRGLRRMNYDCLDGDIEDIVEEYVDVYGIPFDTLPAKGETGTPKPPKKTVLVKAQPSKRNHEIRFPRVTGYIQSIKNKIKADFTKAKPIQLDPEIAPTDVETGGIYSIEIDKQNRERAYKSESMTIKYIANQILHKYLTKQAGHKVELTDMVYKRRLELFPQFYKITRKFVEDFVFEHPEVKIQDIILRKYQDPIITQLLTIIEPDTEGTIRKTFPQLERFKPMGTTQDVFFRTSKVNECKRTNKSHVNYVVGDEIGIKEPMKILETLPYVFSYVRNDHLEFHIPKIRGEISQITGDYVYPDYICTLLLKDYTSIPKFLSLEERSNELVYVIIHYASGLDAFLDAETEKEKSINQWVEAVNNLGGFGSEYGFWIYIRKNPADKLEELLENKRDEIIQSLETENN